MLTNQELAYVGRFACGWHRLSTTDPGRSLPVPLYATVEAAAAGGDRGR